MKKIINLYSLFILLLLLPSCNTSGPPLPESIQVEIDSNKTLLETEYLTTSFTKPPKAEGILDTIHPDTIIPGHIIYEEIFGDINKDNIEDRIVIVKGTDMTYLVMDDYRGELDRNRRGLMIFLGGEKPQKLVVKNLDCFSSENEEGGVYYPPQLSIEIIKGNLIIQYHHGRYGYWNYTFRCNEEDFDLIGYDHTSSYGPIINASISINFLTKKKKETINVNEDTDESGDEIYKDYWTRIEQKELIKLSGIKDFDELNFPYDERE